MPDAMKHLVGECPNPASMAAFLDGRLSGRERTRIITHVADCEECSFVLSEAAQTRAPTAVAAKTFTGRWRAWIARPAVLWRSVGALAAAAALVVAVGSGALAPWRSGPPADLRALVAAVGTDRPVEARLTGGFAYGRLREPIRGVEGSSHTGSPDVRIAAAEIEKKTLGGRTPESLDSLGIAYLVAGDVDRAVLVLQEAAEQAHPDARVLSDLSAAYLTRATRSNQPQDLANALTMADRAVKANPRLAEAWFNRAVALERLKFIDQARDAWRDYLKIDGQSGWAAEATLHHREVLNERRP